MYGNAQPVMEEDDDINFIRVYSNEEALDIPWCGLIFIELNIDITHQSCRMKGVTFQNDHKLWNELCFQNSPGAHN